MSRKLFRWAAICQICLALFTGCHPTQPFFVPRNQSLANYMDQQLDIEYADVHVDSLPEATMALPPFSPTNPPQEEDFLDLSLEDCIAIALQNTKILRVVNSSSTQSGPVSTSLLTAQPGSLPSIYDPAITASLANTQPLAIDNQGNRINPRGAIRANQVGGVEDALSEFDAQFSAIMGYSTTDRPRNVGPGNVFNPQFFQATDGNAQAALSKRMATGTIATARFNTLYSRNNIPSPGLGRAVPSDYTSAVEVQLIQPLLRGRGTLVNRIPIVLARINEDIALHEFEANVVDLVAEVEHAYWDLYCGYRALDAAREARDQAEESWRIVAKRVEAGALGKEAEAQARGLVKQFETQLGIAFSGSSIPGNDPLGLIGREQLLREKMGLSPSDGRFIRPSDHPTEARVAFDWESVKAEGLQRNIFLRRQKWAIKQRELELVSARNQILPQLDLNATYRWVGVGDEFAAASRSGIAFPNPGSNSLEELTGGDYQEIAARLEYTPQAIGKRRANALITNAKFQLAKSQEELREKEVAVIQKLENSVRLKQSHFDSIHDLREQLEAHEDEIEVYKKQVQLGVRTSQTQSQQLNALLDILLRAVERKARAELQYYQAICEYNKSLVNIHYDKGSLLDLNAISLGEGAWVEKAYWDAEERAKERAGGIYFDYGYTRPSVVSGGPVPSAMGTEGNLPSPGSASNLTPGMAEELGRPEELGEEGDDLRPLPPSDNIPITSIQNSSSGSVRQASTASATMHESSYDWGGLGLESQRSPVIAGSSARRISDSRGKISSSRTISDASGKAQGRSSGQPDLGQWRPAKSR